MLRTEVRVVLFSALFVGGLAAVYWFTSYEDAGTTMLALAAAAYSMLCGYLYFQARKFGGARPEDIEEPAARGAVGLGAGTVGAGTTEAAALGAGTTEVGYFPAASVWPAALALGAVLAALGLVFGYWFFVIAAIFLVGAIIGYAVEAQVPH